MDEFRRKSFSLRALLFFPIYGNERNRAGSMAVHVVRVYHSHFVKRESNPRAGATTSRTAASLRLRCNSAILARIHTNISKRIIDACPVSKALPFLPQFYLVIFFNVIGRYSFAGNSIKLIIIVFKSINSTIIFEIFF